MLLILASHVSPTTADPSPNQFSCSTNIWRQLPHSICSNDIFGPPCWRLAISFMHHFCIIGLIQCKLVDCRCISVSLFLLDQAKEEEKRGNIASARAKANISLGLNIAAVVFVLVVWSVVAIPVAVTVSAQTPTRSPYCYSAASSLYYCYQSICYMFFHSLNVYCYYSNSYSYSAASNYYSSGGYSTYYKCDCV